VLSRWTLHPNAYAVQHADIPPLRPHHCSLRDTIKMSDPSSKFRMLSELHPAVKNGIIGNETIQQTAHLLTQRSRVTIQQWFSRQTRGTSWRTGPVERWRSQRLRRASLSWQPGRCASSRRSASECPPAPRSKSRSSVANSLNNNKQNSVGATTRTQWPLTDPVRFIFFQMLITLKIQGIYRNIFKLSDTVSTTNLFKS